MSEVALMCSGLRSLKDLPRPKCKEIEQANSINLHCNQLNNLHGLRSIISITSLNLSSNEFTSTNLPELCVLPNLTSVDFAGNLIESIRDFPFLPSLTFLSLAFNRLNSVEGIENCPNLTSLDIRANLISELSDLKALESLPSLEILSLSDKNNKKSNPVCFKYAKNASLLNFIENLKVLDGIELHLLTMYDDLEDIQTPKFDMLVKRFRPSSIHTENIFNSTKPEKVLINITKTGGAIPHTDVEILTNSEIPLAPQLITTDSSSLSTIPPPLPSLFAPTLPVEAANPWTDTTVGQSRHITTSCILPISDVPPVSSSDCESQTENYVAHRQEMSLRLLVRTLKHIEMKSLQYVFRTLLVHSLQSLNLQPSPAGIEGGYGSFLCYEDTVSATQTDEPGKESFPNIYDAAYKECEESFIYKEKLQLRKFLETELKLKNDLAFKSQMLESAEKKRIHLVLHHKTEIGNLQRVIEEMTVKTIDETSIAASTIQTLQIELLENKTNFKTLNVEFESSQSELISLKSLLEQEHKHKENFKNNVEILEQGYRIEISRLQETLSNVTSQILENKEREENERKQMEDQLTGLIKLLQDKSNEIEKLHTSKDSNVAIQQEYSKELEIWKSRCSHLTEMIDNLKAEFLQRNSYLENKIEKQRGSLYELRTLSKDLKEAKEEISSQCRELELALQLSKENEINIKSQAARQSSSLNEKLLQLEKGFSNLSVVNGQISLNPLRIGELEKKNNELETNLKVKTTMLDDQNIVMKNLKDKNFELENQHKFSVQQIDALEEDVRGFKKIVLDLEGQLTYKKKIEIQLRKLIKELSSDICADDDVLHHVDKANNYEGDELEEKNVEEEFDSYDCDLDDDMGDIANDDDEDDVD